MTAPVHCEGCGAFMREHPGNHWTCTRCGTEHDVGQVTPRLGRPVLYDADPNCEHQIVEKASGVKCAKCPGWFCYETPRTPRLERTAGPTSSSRVCRGVGLPHI